MRLTTGTTLTALLALVAAAGLLGCAAHAPGATGAMNTGSAPRPVGRASIAQRHEVGGGDETRATAAREALDAAFTAGQAALVAGDDDTAYDDFDKAIESVMSADVDLDAHPELKDRAEEVLASINDLATAEAAEADSEDADIEHPKLDGQAAADTVDAIQVAAGTYANVTIPMVDHPSVDAMVRFYTQSVKDRFELGLQRYGKYGPTVARIFKEEGVPPELAWLALVESNYNPQAYSRARARGLWQFIPGTGRIYGLKQDFWIDERSDFEKATRSAARYLRELHGMFGDWHLALAGYNAGEGKIARAIRSTGRSDFWRIRETRYIRRETKDYVPAFLAVLKIVQNPAAYGINFAPAQPLCWETTTVSSATDLSVIAECAGTSVETIQDLNPELRRGTTPGQGDAYALRIPVGSTARFAEKYATLPPEQLLTWKRHVVGHGETLTGIARAYGSSVGGIMAANNLRSASAPAGAVLVIPQGAAADAVPASVLASRAPNFAGDHETSGGARRTYRVRPGDTLGKIAARYGTSPAKLASWNGLRNSNRIHVGQRLVLYGGHAAPASRTASRPATSSRSTAQRTTQAGTASAAKASTRHVVRRGETLSAIARRYNCSIDNLCAWNDIHKSQAIHPGDRLTVGRN